MLGPGGEVEEEWLVGSDLLGVGDKRDRLVSEVLGEVVALLGGVLRLHSVVVGGQLGVVLVGIATHEPEVAVEAAAQRPAIIRARCRDLVGGCEMPLADGVGVVPLAMEDLGQEAVLERDVAVGARVAGRAFGDARHGIRVVVAASEDARSRR